MKRQCKYTLKKLNPLELKLRIEELRTKYSHNQQLRLEYYNSLFTKFNKGKTEELDKETPITEERFVNYTQLQEKVEKTNYV